LSQEEFVELKAKDPLSGLNLVVTSKSYSFNQPHDTSTSIRVEFLVNTHVELLQKFQENVLNVDLFQTIRHDTGAYYEMKGLLEILINYPESAANRSLISFLVKFEPLLDK